jgi:hypothetical protein
MLCPSLGFAGQRFDAAAGSIAVTRGNEKQGDTSAEGHGATILRVDGGSAVLITAT